MNCPIPTSFAGCATYQTPSYGARLALQLLNDGYTRIFRQRGITVRPIRYAWLTIAIAMILTLALSSLSAAQVIVGGYPYPAYRYAARDSAVRFDVKPHETAVYLDGYYA